MKKFVCVIFFLLLILIVGTLALEMTNYGENLYWRPRNIIDVSYDHAKEAIGFMKDWAIWMASLQSATLAAVAALARDGKLGSSQRAAAALTLGVNGIGLLFTAWTLSSIPSLLVRMSRVCDNIEKSIPPIGSCDFYELPFMGSGVAPRFAFFSTWQHWLWVFGLISFAWLVFISIGKSSQSSASH